MCEYHQHGPGSDAEGPASPWWIVGACVVGSLISLVIVLALLRIVGWA